MSVSSICVQALEPQVKLLLQLAENLLLWRVESTVDRTRTTFFPWTLGYWIVHRWSRLDQGRTPITARPYQGSEWEKHQQSCKASILIRLHKHSWDSLEEIRRNEQTKLEYWKVETLDNRRAWETFEFNGWNAKSRWFGAWRAKETYQESICWRLPQQPSSGR